MCHGQRQPALCVPPTAPVINACADLSLELRAAEAPPRLPPRPQPGPLWPLGVSGRRRGEALLGAQPISAVTTPLLTFAARAPRRRRDRWQDEDEGARRGRVGVGDAGAGGVLGELLGRLVTGPCLRGSRFRMKHGTHVFGRIIHHLHRFSSSAAPPQGL